MIKALQKLSLFIPHVPLLYATRGLIPFIVWGDLSYLVKNININKIMYSTNNCAVKFCIITIIISLDLSIYSMLLVLKYRQSIYLQRKPIDVF